MITQTLTFIKGGPGSGHFGHAGRPGKRGGSLPGRGTGAAMSVFSGKYARIRQYLRGQGIVKARVDYIINSGAADVGVGPLDLVGLRGGVLKKAGIAQAQPHIDEYKKGKISLYTLTERLGGNPRGVPRPSKVKRLPKSQRLREQMQARVNVGKPQVGDMFRVNNPNWSGQIGVHEVIEVDHESGNLMVLGPKGDEESFRLWGRGGRFEDEYGRTEYGHERVAAIVDHEFSMYEKIDRGRLEVGDYVGEIGNAEGPFRVIDVDDFGGVALADPGGGQFDFSVDDIKEYLEPWDENRVVIEWPQGFNPSDVSQDQLGRPVDSRVTPIVDSRTPLDVSTDQLENMINGPIVFLDSLSAEANRNGVSESRVGQLADGTMVQAKHAGYNGNNKGERLYYELSNAVGASGMVSQATIREDTGEAVRTWVEGKSWRDIQRDGEGYEYEFLVDERDFEVMTIMDAVAGATDRHDGNFVLKESGQLIIIDNDFAFDGRMWEYPDETYRENIERYFQTTANHYYDITGDYLYINSATIRQIADYARQASVLQEHIDLEGNSFEELDMFKRRITNLYRYADWLDEEYGGEKNF